MSKLSRRAFISQASLAAFASLLGARIVFGERMPEGLVPLGIDNLGDVPLEGKNPALKVLNNRPVNVETPAHLLDSAITETSNVFVRNNGIPPQKVIEADWRLTIEGESVIGRREYTLSELKSRFEVVSLNLVMECGGNGRNEFNPPAKGNQWGVGAVACPRWTGIRLRDLLNDVGIKEDAFYIGYYGADTHLSGDRSKAVISRGVPIAKALQPESLIAWEINGEPLPELHGYPLRLVFGGWPASTCGKWLNKLVVRDRVHDGAKMLGDSYRVPKYPVEPGAKVPDEDMEIIESMPVKSLITYPKSGAMVKGSQTFEVRGHAWAGEQSVRKVELSIDFGSTWQSCELSQPANRLGWQQWRSSVSLPESGYYELWARATDDAGIMQPMMVPGWNPKGYLNNACHRIAIKRI